MAKTTMPTTKIPAAKKTPAASKAKPVTPIKPGTTTATASDTVDTATAKVASVAAKVLPADRVEIQAQIETLKADLVELTTQLKAQGMEYTSDLRAVASEKATDLKRTAVAKAEVYGDKYNELTADTEAKIRANPLTSVAIAVGAGLVLGALTRR